MSSAQKNTPTGFLPFISPCSVFKVRSRCKTQDARRKKKHCLVIHFFLMFPLASCLLFLVSCMEIKRFELLTPCVQGRCSPSWAKSPFMKQDARNKMQEKILSPRIHLWWYSLLLLVSWLLPLAWAQVDSNHRPRAYQARALTGWAMSPNHVRPF